MKLNLLPQTVSKGRALKSAWVVGVLVMAGSLVLAVLMSISAHAALAASNTAVSDNQQQAADAVATAAAADGVVASAADVIRDANLSKQMIDHNDVYPKLYSDILPYVPKFFRLTSIAATPVDSETSTVTLQGTLGSYQQYADVILSLMRFKDATSISRSGYNYDRSIVPNLTPEDPVGTPRKQNTQPIPTDQLERLTYYQNQVPQNAGYSGQGNYGQPGNETRGALPGQSAITIVMTVKRNLLAPDAQQTLAAAGSASTTAAGGTTGGFGGPGGVPPGVRGPSGPGGMPPGAGGPPAGGGRLNGDGKAAKGAGGDGD